ncbi:TPA: replication endonuclease, partial [Escherichia coli]|nr:replication endonuclease [Escherichia coli]HBK3138467.1 replication endonuclease [Escherichia coli]
DGSKGTPTSYIATYIGKNLDSRAVDGIDPKTGKPRVDHETGKSMAESVERAIGWARLHRVRQFQFFGIPSRQVWRELRRLASQMARNPEGPQRLKDDAMDAVLAAADAGCFASYIEKQGGVLVPRKDYLIRTAYDLADELNDYGEQSVQIYGIWSPLIGESSRVCTHPDNWKLVRRKPEAEDSARENGFDLQGGPAAPWTRGNNCPRVQETDNNGTEQPEERPTPWPQLPDGVEVNEWMRSLKQHERRALMRSLRDKQAKNSSDEMQNWTQSRKQPRPLPDNHELLAKEWRESAESLGLHIGEQQMQHLLRGGSLYVDGSIIAPQGFEIVRKPDTRPDSRITQLWQRLSRNHGVSSTEIRHNPVASYLEQLGASDPEAAARLASTLQQDQNTMKTPVTVLSDMLRAIRDAEHAQRISETTERAHRKADLLRGGLTRGNKKQTETGFTNPVNEQKTCRDI